MVGKAYPPDTIPRPYDVVWSFFPYDEARGVPATEPHPALVFGVNEYKAGLFSVQVAYGSSNVSRGDRDLNFVVTNYNALQAAGLRKETFFDLGRTRWLMWHEDWFASPDLAKYHTPVIGKIIEDIRPFLIDALKRRRQRGLPCP